jgi:uncharacterized membrane protein HdeD (DUF308 family)
MADESKLSSTDAANEPNTRQFRALGVLGILCAIVGLWCLLDPTIPTNTQVVNLQMLAIGITLCLSGAVFIAAQWGRK